MRKGFQRPLNRTDAPFMMGRAHYGKGERGQHVGAHRVSKNLSALKTHGLNPFTMAPVCDKAIQATKDAPSFTEKTQLDADATSLHEDAGEDEKAEGEFFTQLMGGKFSTGKMVRCASTSKRFLMVARTKKRIAWG